MKLKAFAIVLLLLGCFQDSVDASKILFLIPFPGPSHWLMMQHFIKELTQRGHEVTAVTSFKLNGEISNYTEILIDPPYPMTDTFRPEEIFFLKYQSDFSNLFMYWKFGTSTSLHGLQNEKVQKLISSTDIKFDLIISEQFFQESWLMFAHKFDAPIVTIGTYGYSDFMDHSMGLVTPWSHVPHMLLNYDDNMTFFQRSYNVLLSSVDAVLRKYYYMPEQEKIAKAAFGELEKLGKPLPSVYDLEKSIAIKLINSHPSIHRPRPAMPGIIDIAGAHIKPAKSLPQDIQEFLDGAKDGAIYFSLGAYLKSAYMPKEKVKVILDVFQGLKQRVLWKWEDENNIPDLPKNVMVRKWMPQSDILAHPNVVLFMSHGGMFGTLEGIHRGVPMLYIPFFGDQHRNALKSEKNGQALTLKFQELTKTSLSAKIQELVTNKKYYNRAKEVSLLFRDNLVSPMETSMYWMEYVIRNKGANHLKSAARDMPVHRYLLWDVYGLFLLILYGVCKWALWMLQRIRGMFKASSEAEDTKKSN